ncbi:CBO0543 family protein [Calidifontibacillus oryziterrae]|uniref:CBO0543 family protein n=1 Tax=Calidifontibacillus oryziterrae TaxID=1191699 RepID=UPI000366F9F1
MNIAKHSNSWSSQRLQKKQYRYSIKRKPNLITPLLVGTLFGTYVDLYFVGKGLYSFPVRPMPTIFSINILFTLVILPLFSAFFLLICNKINGIRKMTFFILVSLCISFCEKLAAGIGFFVPSPLWNHSYSFIGYFLYLLLIYYVYKKTYQY